MDVGNGYKHLWV